jgi:two-component system, LuxR family, sensor kinase FixL
LLHEALRIAGVGGWEYDPASGDLSWSEETYRIYGVDPALETPSLDLFFDLIHPDDRSRVRKRVGMARDSGDMFEDMFRIVRRDGALRTISGRGQVVVRGANRTQRVLGIIQDVTEKVRIERSLAEERAVAEKLQADLIHISRVSAMGTMASALAHELNQPLAAILNYAAALRMLSARDETPLPVAEAVSGISDNAHRAGEIIRRLRLMTTRGEVFKAPIELTPCIVEAAHLALTGAAVPVAYDIAPDLRIEGDRVQIQQVVVNLVRNAAEAMPGMVEKRIEIAARRDGQCADIVVRDSGPGIDPALLPTIFDSFVSTKEDGMGVGLAISRTIVEAHGGRITAESTPGRGTTFRLRLPLARD